MSPSGAPVFLIYLLYKHITLKGSHFYIKTYIIALIAHYIGRRAISSYFTYIYYQFNQRSSFIAVGFFYGSSAFFLQYTNMFTVIIISINAIRKIDVCWIMYQSSHNVRRGQKIFKSKRVFKVENRNKEFWNFKIFRNTVLGNFVKIIFMY